MTLKIKHDEAYLNDEGERIPGKKKKWKKIRSYPDTISEEEKIRSYPDTTLEKKKIEFRRSIHREQYNHLISR